MCMEHNIIAHNLEVLDSALILAPGLPGSSAFAAFICSIGEHFKNGYAFYIKNTYGVITIL